MYHTIQFFTDFVADLEVSPQRPLQRVLIQKGSRLLAELKPYVAESRHGPVEMADLFLEDRSRVRAVPFACIAFVE
jgi:hypothetical protein